MKIIWICFLCLISFSAVSEDRRYDVSTQKYTYYSGELGNFDLEVDLPQHDMGQVPYMIYIHGGGWQHGDLNVFKKHSIYMTERGIAGVRISYPLINQGGSLKRVMELIEKSVSFIRKHEKLSLIHISEPTRP